MVVAGVEVGSSVGVVPEFEDFYRAEVASVTALAFALCGSRPAAEASGSVGEDEPAD